MSSPIAYTCISSLTILPGPDEETSAKQSQFVIRFKKLLS
jgi:hypothetical protein